MASPEPPELPFFDRNLNVWVLSRYGDVTEALREPRLVPVSGRSAGAAVVVDAALHTQFRAEAFRMLAPARLRAWEEQFGAMAHRMVRMLPIGQPVDLLSGFFKPWSLEVAALAAEVPAEESERLADLACAVFDAGAEPYDAALEEPCREATQQLAGFFRNAPALHTQMFIALAHSLPAFLGNAWLALFECPAQLARLRREPALLPRAVEELLRFAGPARAQFRQAIGEVTIGGCEIHPEEKIILWLERANRDPERFDHPNELDFDRRSGEHLAFGGGIHACVLCDRDKRRREPSRPTPSQICTACSY